MNIDNFLDGFIKAATGGFAQRAFSALPKTQMAHPQAPAPVSSPQPPAIPPSPLPKFSPVSNPQTPTPSPTTSNGWTPNTKETDALQMPAMREMLNRYKNDTKLPQESPQVPDSSPIHTNAPPTIATPPKAETFNNQPNPEWTSAGLMDDGTTTDNIYRDRQNKYHDIYTPNHPTNSATPSFKPEQESQALNRFAPPNVDLRAITSARANETQSPQEQQNMMAQYGAHSMNEFVDGGKAQNDYAEHVVPIPSPKMFGPEDYALKPQSDTASDQNMRINMRNPEVKRLLDMLDTNKYYSSSDPGIREAGRRDLLKEINQEAAQNPEMARDVYLKIFGNPQQQL